MIIKVPLSTRFTIYITKKIKFNSMGPIEVLLSVLSGFAIIAFFLIFKLLKELAKVQIDLRVAKINCQKDIDRLEDKISHHVNYDTRKLNDSISNLQSMQDKLLHTLDKYIESPQLSKDKELING